MLKQAATAIKAHLEPAESVIFHLQPDNPKKSLLYLLLLGNQSRACCESWCSDHKLMVYCIYFVLGACYRIL